MSIGSRVRTDLRLPTADRKYFLEILKNPERRKRVDELELKILPEFFAKLRPKRRFALPESVRLFWLLTGNCWDETAGRWGFRWWSLDNLETNPGGRYGKCELNGNPEIWLEIAFRGDKGAQYVCCDVDAPGFGRAGEYYDSNPRKNDLGESDFTTFALNKKSL